MSESYESFCECDYDGASSFCHEETRRARKQHRCGECGGSIAIGEQYEYSAGKAEGMMWYFKTCSRCMSLVDYIKAHVPCYCRLHGDLFEDRLVDMVREAQQTPGFAFGMLRRIIAINRHRYQKT